VELLSILHHRLSRVCAWHMIGSLTNTKQRHFTFVPFVCDAGSFLRPKLRSLLGRITSNMSTDSTVWVLYGDLYGNGVLGSTDDKMKAVEILHKALRTGMQKANWDKDEELTDNNVRVACKLSTGKLFNVSRTFSLSYSGRRAMLLHN